MSQWPAAGHAQWQQQSGNAQWQQQSHGQWQQPQQSNAQWQQKGNAQWQQPQQQQANAQWQQQPQQARQQQQQGGQWSQGQQQGGGGWDNAQWQQGQQQARQQPQWPQQQQQRAAPQAEQGGSTAAPQPQTDGYVVVTSGPDGEEVVIKTLVGEYVPKGENHGRKFYQKVSAQHAAEMVEVFMYYWDNRDGPAFEGWWFGNKLGGTQVWSQCKSSDMTPPATGWKIPWDGAVRTTLSIVGKAEHQQKVQQEKAAMQAKAREEAQRKADAEALEKAQALLAKVHEHLSPAETAVDEAEEAAIVLSREDVTKEMVQEVEKATTKAAQLLTAALGFIAKEKAHVSAVVKEELAKLEQRGKDGQERVTKLKAGQKEALERMSSESLLKEAVEKIQAVAEAVGKAADAEGPFLMGVEELPLEDTLLAVKACETAAQAANTVTSIAKMFIATKLVEVRRWSEGPAAEASSQLKARQAELEKYMKKLADLKERTAARKKKVMVKEAEAQVNSVEALVEKVTEAAAVFEDDEKFLELSADDIRKAAEETSKAETAASQALTEARKFMTAKQIESKSKNAPAEISEVLIKFQTRLSDAQTQVGKLKKITSTVEQRIALKQVIEESTGKLQALEEKVVKSSEMVTALIQNDTPVDDPASKEADTAVNEGTVLLKTLTRYLEAQTRGGHPLAKEELAKLQPKVRAAQDMLETLAANMKERSEKMQLQELLKEAKGKVKDAEDAVTKAAQAEEPFLGKEELPVKEAGAALTELENACQAAQTQVNAVKTFLAMKKLNAKRLAEGLAKIAQEELAKMQTDFEATAKKLNESRRGMNERKMKTVKMEVAWKMEEVEKALQAATVLTMSLSGLTEDGESAAMKEACEKAAQSQTEAQAALMDAKDVVLQRQREAKNSNADSAALSEFTTYLDKLNESQTSLDAQKATLKDSEHRFVAKQLTKEAASMVEELEQKLEETKEACAPYAGGKQDFTMTIFMGYIVEALRSHSAKAAMSLEDLYSKIKGEDSGISEAKFIEFMLPLPELKANQEGFEFGDIELKATHNSMCRTGSDVVDEESFLAKFKRRYVVAATVAMTDNLTIKGGKTIRKLQEHEEVEAMGEPAKDDAIGLFRVKAKALKDGVIGYVTVAGNQGTTYLSEHSAYKLAKMQINAKLKEMQEELTKISSYLDTKLQGMKDVKRVGPLSEAKQAIMGAKPRVHKADMILKKLCRDVEAAEKQNDQSLEIAKKKQKEAADKRAVEKMMQEVNGKANELQSEVDKVVPAAEEVVKSASAATGNPLQAIDKATADLQATLVSIEKSQESVMVHFEKLKQVRGPQIIELRSTLTKLKVRLGAYDSRCKKQMVALKAARKQVTADSHAAVMAALRDHVQQKSISVESLTQELGKGGDITMEALRKYIEKIPGNKLKALQLDLALERYSKGITKLIILEMLQEFQKCVKEIAITTTREVKASKTQRKLNLGEIVQILEIGKADASMVGGLQRVRGRALSDLTEGWISTKGNQGTFFLTPTSKPYYCCQAGASLQSGSESGSSEVRRILPGEVFEVLEGPRKEAKIEIFRVRCKDKDGNVGWATQKIGSSDPVLEAVKTYVCKGSTALTENFDLGGAKAIRKLEVGEEVDLLEGPQQDSARNLTRMKGRCKSDGQEGWVTMKGNKGTEILAEEASKFSVCKAAVDLEQRMILGSKVLRSLEEGEQVEILEGPKTQSKEGASRVRGRNFSDGAEGWFDMIDSNWQPWAPLYRCSSSVALNDQLDSTSSQELRQLVVGETLEALDTPVADVVSGQLTLRVRAQSDGASGFATVKGAEGEVYLEPVPVSAS